MHAMCGTMAVETSRATQGQGNATRSQNGVRAIMECGVYIVYSEVLHTRSLYSAWQ